MTVSSTLNKIIYQGNASTTSFPFTFSFPGGTATQEAANILVFFTDALGNITQLIQGSGPTNYQITFNPPSGTNPTPSGGTVTYNPNGTPIAVGTSLTIFRSLPLTQSVSIANQGTLYQPVTEAALDYLTMISQQVLEVQSRALVVPISDPTPTALPTVSERKNLVLGFDSSGNPIAVSGLSAGVVSSAMQPVVNAASLAAGRVALGLGSVATESIGLGLQDNGSGSLQTFFPATIDSANQTVTSAFHQNVRSASASITYILPLSSTLFNGFGFFIYTQSNPITIAPNAADAFNGATTGASIQIGAGQRVFVSTNASSVWFIQGNVTQGFNAAQNLVIVTSVAASALTISVKDSNGNDPSPASPIIFTVSTGGSSLQRAVATPLSITIPNGAMLGTVNGQANRIWLGIFDNAGTPVLGVYNSLSSTGPSILPWDETSTPSTTAISAGSTSAQTWYTQGVSLTGKAFRILGFVESTQPTAGAWTSSPSKGQLFGPGVKRPGDTVQSQSAVINAASTTTSATFVALASQNISITPQSAANPIQVTASGLATTNVTQTVGMQLSRGTVAATGLFGSQSGGSIGTAGAAIALNGTDIPNTTGATTYAVQGKITTGQILTYSATQTFMQAQEIQI